MLSILTGSMLAIATFAVGAMVSAYGSASSQATPRSFEAVIADDTSQNALSIFIGSFIFSVIGLVYLQNEILGPAARTIVFVLTLVTYGLVIYTFVRWVDQIARLGRMGTTIANVEKVCLKAIKRRSAQPHMQACPLTKEERKTGIVITANDIGYIQRIDVAALQKAAKNVNGQIYVHKLPGDYVGTHETLACFQNNEEKMIEFDPEKILKAFQIGRKRLFDEDPRFGIVVLSEIASRALSPGVNDPGTAIDVMGSLHRLFAAWKTGSEKKKDGSASYDRVHVPEIGMLEMMDDAFSSIGRDGAEIVEVLIRLHKVLGSISHLDMTNFQEAARHQAEKSLARARLQMSFEPDIKRIENLFASTFGNITNENQNTGPA